MEQTLVILKPDCVQRKLIGAVLSRLEQKGLNLIALKLMQVDRELSKQHYREHVNKPFYPSLEQFITGSPVVAAVFEGPAAVKVVRDLMGPTSGIGAPSGTIRGDFALSKQLNLIHGSDSPESARREIELWFRPEELHPNRPDLTPWIHTDEDASKTS